MMYNSQDCNDYKSIDPLYTKWERNYRTKTTNCQPAKAYIRNADNNNLNEERR